MAQCAQWAARHHNGQFGRQPHKEAGLIQAPPSGPTYLIIEGDNESSVVGPFVDARAAEHALGSSPLVLELLGKDANSARFAKDTDPLPQDAVSMYDADQALEPAGFAQIAAA